VQVNELVRSNSFVRCNIW